MLNPKLIYIIFASFIFSGELEVDGDLTVTGNIQNQTIDSLMQVIQDLQNQFADMQNQLSILNESASSTLKLLHIYGNPNYESSFTVPPNFINELVLINIEKSYYGYVTGVSFVIYIDGIQVLNTLGGFTGSGFNDSNSEWNTDLIYFYPSEQQIANGFTVSLEWFGNNYSISNMYVYGK